MTEAAPGLPLSGLRIVVTRAAGQAADLSERLEALGAVVGELPAIEIVPLSSTTLDERLLRLSDYDWVVLTSANGVEIFAARMREMDVPIPTTRGWRVAAIGAATATRLRQHHLPVDLIPDRAVAEGLLEALVATGVEGRRLLLPVAEGARNVLPDGLSTAGATVDVVATYRTVRPHDTESDVLRLIRDGAVDVLTFASPSAVRNTVELIGAAMPVSVAIACIGPITARAAHDLGLAVDIEAQEHSIVGLIDAISAWAAERAPQKEQTDVR